MAEFQWFRVGGLCHPCTSWKPIYFCPKGHLLWMDEVMHQLRGPRGMIPKQWFQPWFPSGAQYAIHLPVGSPSIFTQSPPTVGGRNPAPLGIHEKPLFIGIYRGLILPGFLRWCEMDFVHPQYGASGGFLGAPSSEFARTSRPTTPCARRCRRPSSSGRPPQAVPRRSRGRVSFVGFVAGFLFFLVVCVCVCGVVVFGFVFGVCLLFSLFVLLFLWFVSSWLSFQGNILGPPHFLSSVSNFLGRTVWWCFVSARSSKEPHPKKINNHSLYLGGCQRMRIL